MLERLASAPNQIWIWDITYPRRTPDEPPV
ncbi:hypothetical protein SAMN05443639_10780 [Stigmatella erecta]|uniref:Uncharacterized protein n=1 Tax=Stigmatella erecta TaxID=83460 RepID=A0A1I0JBB1_9BACT|nr:hypothetical protein SAMN05443639_10780 [Stigmatella erecta]